MVTVVNRWGDWRQCRKTAWSLWNEAPIWYEEDQRKNCTKREEDRIDQAVGSKPKGLENPSDLCCRTKKTPYGSRRTIRSFQAGTNTTFKSDQDSSLSFKSLKPFDSGICYLLSLLGTSSLHRQIKYLFQLKYQIKSANVVAYFTTVAFKYFSFRCSSLFLSTIFKFKCSLSCQKPNTFALPLTPKFSFAPLTI